MELHGVGSAAALRGAVAKARSGGTVEAVTRARRRVHALVERLLKLLDQSTREEDVVTVKLAAALTALTPQSSSSDILTATEVVSQRLDEIAGPSDVLDPDEKRDLLVILGLGCGKLSRDTLTRAYNYLLLDNPKFVLQLAQEAYRGFGDGKK